MRGLHKHVMKGEILYPAVSDTPAWVSHGPWSASEHSQADRHVFSDCCRGQLFREAEFAFAVCPLPGEMELECS
jgi:hypothetical protein